MLIDPISTTHIGTQGKCTIIDIYACPEVR
jgi:hypothetical protein